MHEPYAKALATAWREGQDTRLENLVSYLSAGPNVRDLDLALGRMGGAFATHVRDILCCAKIGRAHIRICGVPVATGSAFGAYRSNSLDGFEERDAVRRALLEAVVSDRVRISVMDAPACPHRLDDMTAAGWRSMAIRPLTASDLAPTSGDPSWSTRIVPFAVAARSREELDQTVASLASSPSLDGIIRLIDPSTLHVGKPAALGSACEEARILSALVDGYRFALETGPGTTLQILPKSGNLEWRTLSSEMTVGGRDIKATGSYGPRALKETCSTFSSSTGLPVTSSRAEWDDVLVEASPSAA